MRMVHAVDYLGTGTDSKSLAHLVSLRYSWMSLNRHHHMIYTYAHPDPGCRRLIQYSSGHGGSRSFAGPPDAVSRPWLWFLGQTDIDAQLLRRGTMSHELEYIGSAG